MSYELSYSDHGFVICFKGHVTIEELNEGNGRIQGHPEFDSHHYQIVDLLAADLSSVTDEEARVPAAIDAVAARFRPGVRVALVATQEHALAAANSYVKHARQTVPDWEFGVFPTRQDALEWATS